MTLQETTELGSEPNRPATAGPEAEPAAAGTTRWFLWFLFVLDAALRRGWPWHRRAAPPSPARFLLRAGGGLRCVTPRTPVRSSPEKTGQQRARQTVKHPKQPLTAPSGQSRGRHWAHVSKSMRSSAEQKNSSSPEPPPVAIPDQTSRPLSETCLPGKASGTVENISEDVPGWGTHRLRGQGKGIPKRRQKGPLDRVALGKAPASAGISLLGCEMGPVCCLPQDQQKPYLWGLR